MEASGERIGQRILFLDDDEHRHKVFQQKTIGDVVVFVKTYEDAVRELDKGGFDEAHLDHDLSEMAAAGMPAEGELSGTDLANYIVRLPKEKWPTRIIIHSHSDKGSRRMFRILREGGHLEVMRFPFGMLWGG